MTAMSQTLVGPLKGSQEVDLEGIVLSEFFKTLSLEKLMAHVYHTDCWYDAIIGCDVLNQLGVLLDFKER